MATKSNVMSSTTLLSVAVGLFLVLSGIQNLIDASSFMGKLGGMFQSDLSKTVGIVSAILKIVSGAVLVVGPLGLLTKGIRMLAFWVIVIFWAALTIWMASTTVNALKGDGIADRDIQTSNFSIYPQYRNTEPKKGVIEPPQVVGYEVSNTLTLKVRDLQKLGGLIDRSVKLGVNQGGQITFTNDKPDEAVTEARKKAVAEALAKAKTLTEAAGVKLGRILEISENSMRPAPQPMMRMAMAKDMAAEAVPVASGENTYTVTVNVTFALEQ